jgi:hypothetical protein
VSKQQQLLKKELSVSQILRTHGRQFRQIQMRYSDGLNGRCAMGVIMSYFGWDGSQNYLAANDIIAVFYELKQVGVDGELLIDLNDSGFTFNEIADYIDLCITSSFDATA